jgi:hypothetical protein
MRYNMDWVAVIVNFKMDGHKWYIFLDAHKLFHQIQFRLPTASAHH